MLQKLPFQIFVLLFIGVCGCVLSAPKCDVLSPCACKLTGVNNSGIIDLSYLSRDSNSSTPRFDTIDTKLQWHYSFSPCQPFNIFTEINTTTVQRCHNSIVARWTKLGAVPECTSIGDPKPAEFSYVDSALTVEYKNVTDTKGIKVIRRAIISLVCNASMTSNHSVFTLVKTDDPKNSYYFRLESPCCCPDGCPRSPTPTDGPGTKDNHITKETVIIIAVLGLVFFFVAVVAAYFISKRNAAPNAAERDPLVTA